MGKNDSSPKEASKEEPSGAKKGINWREHYLKFVGFAVAAILVLYLSGIIKVAVDDYTLGLLVILVLLPLIERIQKIKFKDIEVVMVDSAEVDDAKKKASEAQKEQAEEKPAAKKGQVSKKMGAQVRAKGLFKMAIPHSGIPVQGAGDAQMLSLLESRLYEEADSSPGAALVSLSAELEKQVSRIYASRGGSGAQPFASPRQMISELRSHEVFGESLFEGLNAIFSIRNRIAHGERLKPSDARALVDSGMKLMRILVKM